MRNRKTLKPSLAGGSGVGTRETCRAFSVLKMTHFAIRALEQKKIELSLELDVWTQSPATIKEIREEISDIEAGLEVLKKHLENRQTFEDWLKQFTQTGWVYWRSVRVGYNIDSMKKLYEIERNKQ